MARQLAFTGVARQVERPVRSIACLVFVTLAVAVFWAGAVMIGETFLRMAPPY